MVDAQRKKSLFASIVKPEVDSGRPSSMVVKKAHTVIPAHIVAEAISTIRGLDLRWSGPITSTEMQYVEQYVLAKYPQYAGLIGEKIDLSTLCINEEISEPAAEDKLKSPGSSLREVSSLSSGSNLPDLDRTQLEPSRLLDILTKKSSFPGSFISIPEIQARNKVLKHCGLADEEYLVLFTPTYKDAMMLIGESYPFFRGNFYPADVNGTRYSMHWVSEAHRNSWHVLLDATALVAGEDRLNLALHRPDFVLCSPDNTQAHPSKITCLLVRKKSFETTTAAYQING